MRIDDGKARLVLVALACGVVAAIGVGYQLIDTTSATAPSLAEVDGAGTRPDGAVPSASTVGTVPAEASASAGAAGAIGAEASPSTPAPRPFVHDFAQGGIPRQPAPSPTAIPFEWFRIDCDFAYGVAGQCVSWSRMTEQERAEEDYCGYLSRIGWTNGVVVQETSPDPKNLDRNGDGVGCGPGDLA